MFDLSNPQKRERLLVIAAGIALCIIVMMILPGQFSKLTNLKKERENLQVKINDLKRHERMKDDVLGQMSAIRKQALAPLNNPARNAAMSGYQNWLTGLASGVGFGNVQVREGTAPGARDIYNKVVFTLVGEGRLDQIAEFLRRFHHTDYLHMITSVSPGPSPRNPNVFTTTFRIEVLALPTVNSINVPSADRATTAITDTERQMLETIRNRAILSEYTPPRPVSTTTETEPRVPPPPPFYHSLHCFIEGITAAEGKPQCWIRIRTTGEQHFLFEGEAFTLDGVRATVKKIEVHTLRVHVAAEGGIYTIGLGKPFAHAEEPSYFLTGIVDSDGRAWTTDSTGEPNCVIVCRLEDTNGRMRDIARHLLAAGDSFPMAEVVASVQSIDPTANQIQMEAAGVVYTIKVDGSFSEFADE